MVIELIGDQTSLSIIKLYHHANILNNFPDNLEIVIGSNSFIYPQAIALLAWYCRKAVKSGTTLKFSGSKSKLNYLSRMNLFSASGYSDYNEAFNRHSELGRFLPIIELTSEEAVKVAADSICELIIRNFEDSRTFVPALNWCTYEVIDNIRNHSNSIIPGIVIGQVYPTKRLIKLAIFDNGIGIRNSLSESYKVDTDGEAIILALQKGITRNKNVGQGNGLAGTQEIIIKNGGKLGIISGSAIVHVDNKQEHSGIHDIPYFEGTGVIIEMNIDKPVDLNSTSISCTDWSYLDYLADNLNSSKKIMIQDECLHTEGRQPAKRLRLKLETVLEDVYEQIDLDYSGISTMTNSFFDELVGKLILKHGITWVNKKLRITNLNNDLRGIASAVFKERLDDVL